MHFHIYHLISQCIMYGRCPLYEKKICCLCFQDPDNVTPAKLYIREEIIMMETYIADFHTIFYIPEIKKLVFHLPNVLILGTNHCGNTRREAFKSCSAKKYVLCCCDYSERVVASFHTKCSMNTI